VTGLAVSQGVLAQPGTVAFLVVFGMGLMLFFVFRSMARHLRKVNDAARAAEEAGDPDQVSAQAGPDQDREASGFSQSS
jgi:TRAP-type C4-dicarboxylate transport system permease small subunit